MSWAVNKKPTTRVSFQIKILMRRIWSCIGIIPCEQSSQAIPLLLNRRLKFIAPGYSCFLQPIAGLAAPRSMGRKWEGFSVLLPSSSPTPASWGDQLWWEEEVGQVLSILLVWHRTEPSAAQSSHRKRQCPKASTFTLLGLTLLSASHPCHHQHCFSARTKVQAGWTHLTSTCFWTQLSEFPALEG